MVFLLAENIQLDEFYGNKETCMENMKFVVKKKHFGEPTMFYT